MTKCKGCGATLQHQDKNLPGYSPKENSEYCQRCFRLIHYDDLTVSMKKGIDPDMVIDRIATMDALVLWIVDLFDFEASMIPGINRKLAGMDIIMVASKRDLFPESVGYEKLAAFVFSRLKELGVKIKELLLTSRNDDDSLNDIFDAVAENARGRDVVVMGRANAGKSTLLNRMMSEKTLTMSRYPGTTLDFNEIVINGQTYIDTPGIEIDNSMLMQVEEETLKTIIPQTRVKPIVFQLKDDQSFAIGGLARLDIYDCQKATCVWYLSDRLQIHRSKAANADDLWKKHYGKMLSPVATTSEFTEYSIHKKLDKIDVVVDGLGWACVSGNASTIKVRVPKGIGVTFRKAIM